MILLIRARSLPAQLRWGGLHTLAYRGLGGGHIALDVAKSIIIKSPIGYKAVITRDTVEQLQGMDRSCGVLLGLKDWLIGGWVTFAPPNSAESVLRCVAQESDRLQFQGTERSK
jgi:hypothetical protein